MSTGFIAHLHDLFAALGPISSRAMFGGHGVYFDGRIIGIVIDDAVYLRTDDQTRARFEAAGCTPFVYAGQQHPITTSYWSLPDDAMESPQAMLPWAKLAFEAALRKPGSSKKARKPAK
jgi:DNA transformation protein and related proteins